MIKAQSIIIEGRNKKNRDQKFTELTALSLKDENQPDFLKIDSGETIGIEEVRNIQRWLLLKPFKNQNKIVYLAQAENLTLEAQNAFLKTLEEPPPSAIIILGIPDSSLLLPTIISRCQVVNLPFTNENIDENDSKEMEEIFLQLQKATLGERLILGENLGLYKEKEKALSWLDQLSPWTRKALLGKYFKVKENSFNLSKNQALSLLKLIQKTKNYLRANCNLRLTMEVFLINMPC